MNTRILPLIFFFILIFLLFIHPIDSDGDIYHHLHTGKYIAENLSLPRTDTWTFTERGRAWTAHSWASGLIFYLIYTYSGVFGISLFTALVGTLSILLIFILLKSYHLKNIFIIPILLLMTSIFLIRFPTRPEIFTYPFLTAIFLINNLKRPNLYLFYPLIIFLWSIFYGANVLLGLGVLVFLFFANSAGKSHLELKLFISVIVAILVSLFNGYGLDTIFYFLKISNISSYEGEWLGILSLFKKAPPYYLELFRFRLAIYSIFVLFYLSLLLTHIKFVRNYLWQLILSLAIFLPLITFRQTGLGALLSLPLLSNLLKKHQNIKFSVYLWFLGLFTVLISLSYNFPKMEFKEDTDRIRLVSFISKNNLVGKAYTSQQLGSFISFKFYPNILVSYDTRDDLFTDGRFLRDYLSPAPLELILNKYKADLVILDINTDFQKVNYILNSPNWLKLYFGDHFLVMKRKH